MNADNSIIIAVFKFLKKKKTWKNIEVLNYFVVGTLLKETITNYDVEINTSLTGKRKFLII